MTGLGYLCGFSYSAADAINASGQVVGTAWSGDSYGSPGHVFLYSNGTMTDLGTLPGSLGSYACDLNDSGQVVGDAITASGQDLATIYSDGTWTDLNTLIAPGSGLTTLEQADAINDSGQIVGIGVGTNGTSAAFLLTPVPEPSSIILLGIGAISLLAYGWRKRTRKS
jgi:probable HAF family extracellular repeat protein